MQRVLEWIKSEKFSKLSYWGRKSGFAILDQGVFSGSNFVLNILLARWLSTIDYGAFSVAFVVYLFFTGFHNALILEPMTVLGPSSYADRLREFLYKQYNLHMFFTVILGTIITVIGFVVGQVNVNSSLADALKGAGLALPFMLLIWLTRRIFYVMQEPVGAFWGSVVYSIVLLIGCMVLRNSTWIGNVSVWFWLMGFASAVGSLVALLGGRLNIFRRGTNLHWWSILLTQWKFGRWLVLATILYTVGSQLQVFIVASLIDLETAGTWRATQNFALPMSQAITAISTLGLPALAVEFGRANFQELRRKGMWVTIVLTILAGGYEIVLLSMPSTLEKLLYGGKFASFAWLIPLVGILPVLTAIESGFSLMVRSFQKPIFYAVYTCILAFVGLASGPLLVLKWGIAGAVASQLLVGITSLVVLIYLYHNLSSKLLVEK